MRHRTAGWRVPDLHLVLADQGLIGEDAEQLMRWAFRDSERLAASAIVVLNTDRCPGIRSDISLPAAQAQTPSRQEDVEEEGESGEAKFDTVV
ncbi:hypothetical protein [Muricoccus vinaceus]|uniref:Uncharacterized protein n=1 Tax=Muricoccus vinaceus TaxID=424704 RepID=A0ABV6IZB2_9PROT